MSQYGESYVSRKAEAGLDAPRLVAVHTKPFSENERTISDGPTSPRNC